MLIDGLESCGLLWCFYQLFGLSFWWHPFTAVYPLVSESEKWKWRDIRPSMVTILGICALHLTHPKCTHTAVNTHTPWTHTRSSWQPFMLLRPGSSWGFCALLKGTSVVVLRVERVLDIHSPHWQFLPARDSSSQPLGYESDSLTIGPRLPNG